MFTKEQLLSIIPENQKKWLVPVEKKQEKMIQNALNSYAKDCRREDVVAIYDFTVLGNGKKGYLLATDGMYGYDFHTFKKHTSDVTKIPFEGLKEYYSLKNSPIEAERSIGIGDNLYKFLYEDGTAIVIYQCSVNAEYTIPIIDSVFSLIHAQDEKGSVHSELHSDSVQNEIERKQEELKDQIEVLLRQQEALNRQAEEARLEEERRRAEEARLAEERRQEEEARLEEERRRAEKARLTEERRWEEEARLAEEKRREEEARLAEEKRWLKEQLAEKNRKQQGVCYTVRFLGETGVGKTSLIKALADVAQSHKETVFSESEGRCTIFWKGNTITFIETLFGQIKEENLQADQWYLIVGIDEGPLGLYAAVGDIEKVVLSGVFYNKCDLLFAEDEDMIDLVACETQSILETSNHSEKIQEFRGAAEVTGQFGEVLEKFLDKIDPITAEERWMSEKVKEEGESCLEEEEIRVWGPYSCVHLFRGDTLELDKEPYLVIEAHCDFYKGQEVGKHVVCRNLVTSELRKAQFDKEDGIVSAGFVDVKYFGEREGKEHFLNTLTGKTYAISKDIVKKYIPLLYPYEDVRFIMHQDKPVYMIRLQND